MSLDDDDDNSHLDDLFISIIVLQVAQHVHIHVEL
jgi:hypothetical protein